MGGEELCGGLRGGREGAGGGSVRGVGGSRLDDCYANDPTGERGSFLWCLQWASEGGCLFIFNFFLVQLVGMTFFILVVTVGG